VFRVTRVRVEPIPPGCLESFSPLPRWRCFQRPGTWVTQEDLYSQHRVRFSNQRTWMTLTLHCSPVGRNLSNRMVIVWNRGKAKVNRLFDGAPPETWNKPPSRPPSETWSELTYHSPSETWNETTSRPPSKTWNETTSRPPSETRNEPTSRPPSEIQNEPTCRPPYEIVEAITAHLTRNLDTLKACSLICRTWYLAAVPHLHRTLILSDVKPDKSHAKLKPLSKLHELDLTTFVKEIQVLQGSNEHWFIPQAFGPNDLSHFSAFANVESLVLRNMDISRFIPDIQRYFEHFAPMLQSITLHTPYCTPRQLSYFLSLFSNLDNIYINFPERPFRTSILSTEFVPFSSPKLRGRLELSGFHWVETWTDLITSCGGLRFRHADLHHPTGCAPVLLEACAKTVETLQFLVG